MADERLMSNLLLGLLQQGIENRELLHGVSLGLSKQGRSRIQIMHFFWTFMTTYEAELSESQMDLVGDFCYDLLGRGPIAHIIRLHGDPEDREELAEKVFLEAQAWKAPPEKDRG